MYLLNNNQLQVLQLSKLLYKLKITNTYVKLLSGKRFKPQIKFYI